MALEGLGTFFLLWAIIGVAVNPRATKEWAALAIGGALGVAVLAFAPITGGSFNPARAIGPALASGEWGGFGNFLLIYVLGPLVGAVVAVLLYLRILTEPGAKGVGGAEPVG
jgi:glycerol uptake facilitator-like aquaporin